MNKAEPATELFLGPVLEKDSDTLFEVINDRAVVLYNNTYGPTHEMNHKRWFSSIGSDPYRRIFAIRINHATTGELAGMCQLVNINPVNRSAELQIRLLPSFWDKGLGGKAVHKLLHHAFNDLNLNRVYLYVFESNIRATKLYEKVGFVHEGLLRQSEYIDGKYLSLVVMGLLRDEYTIQ